MQWDCIGTFSCVGLWVHVMKWSIQNPAKLFFFQPVSTTPLVFLNPHPSPKPSPSSGFYWFLTPRGVIARWVVLALNIPPIEQQERKSSISSLPYDPFHCFLSIPNLFSSLWSLPLLPFIFPFPVSPEYSSLKSISKNHQFFQQISTSKEILDTTKEKMKSEKGWILVTFFFLLSEIISFR